MSEEQQAPEAAAETKEKVKTRKAPANNMAHPVCHVGCVVHAWDETRFKQPLAAIVVCCHSDKTVNLAVFTPDGKQETWQGIPCCPKDAIDGTRKRVWSFVG